MERINVAELLKDCPQGMELDCTMYEGLEFDGINAESICTPIRCRLKDSDGIYKTCNFTKYGCWSNLEYAKCVIFPKGKTTWEGFQRPFTDGDIVFTHANCLKVGLGNTWISIFQEKRYGGVATYIDMTEDGKSYYDYIDGSKGLLCMDDDIMRQRFATEEEKQKLFQAIKEHGYKWNAEAKKLEKLVESEEDTDDEVVNDEVVMSGIYFDREHYADEVELHLNNYEIEIRDGKTYAIFKNQETENSKPKFKVGDFVQKEFVQKECATSCGSVYQIIEIKLKDNKFAYTVRVVGMPDSKFVVEEESLRTFVIEDLIEQEYELEHELVKFDMSTLEPFSKVLVRDHDSQTWTISFFDHCNGLKSYKYSCINGVFAQCIPYEKNEHLRGTTNNCDEYFKNW